MSQLNHPVIPQSHNGFKASWRRRAVGLVGVAAAGSLTFTFGTQFLGASADSVFAPSTTLALVDEVEPMPPAGETWIQGLLTDQAGHPVNNVNVEVWPADPDALTPVASNITYAGDVEDGRHDAGVFRVAVPSGTPYRLTFSTVGGKEDGDDYRMMQYGAGRPIASRVITTATSLTAAPGRVIDLGSIALARQGTVASRTSARLPKAKVRAGTRASVTVKVTSNWVSNVTGRIQVKVAGKTLTHRLATYEHGRTSVLLPRLARGKHRVRVIFTGSSTVARSAATPVVLTVTKR